MAGGLSEWGRLTRSRQRSRVRCQVSSAIWLCALGVMVLTSCMQGLDRTICIVAMLMATSICAGMVLWNQLFQNRLGPSIRHFVRRACVLSSRSKPMIS